MNFTNNLGMNNTKIGHIYNEFYYLGDNYLNTSLIIL